MCTYGEGESEDKATWPNLPILGDGKHGLLSSSDLHGGQFRERLAEPWGLDFVPLDSPQLAPVVVSPAVHRERYSQRNYPLLGVPVKIILLIYSNVIIHESLRS